MANHSHDVLGLERRPLDALFSPRTVAVVGASERSGSVGRALLTNLTSSPFGGKVFPVNPRGAKILGVPAFSSVRAIPEPVDLAVVATPAATVPDIVSECVEAGVKGAIIISAGFKEIGRDGVELERSILERVQNAPTRIIGPNCLGLMCPRTGLNASFAGALARPGSLGFVSQSGALCSAVLDWSRKARVGFSAFVSAGSMLDVGWGDLIDHLGDDPHTKSILIYMESVGDPRSFLSAAREVALTKPIIVLKSGRAEPAARAAESHTGALSGRDDVLDAAFRRVGVLRVDTISELFALADVLSKQPRPRGPKLTIVTNAGGPGVLATDALIHEGGKLAELPEPAVKALDAVLPPHWSRANPIDILGDAEPSRYSKALEVVTTDALGDGLLVILTPQSMTDSTRTAAELARFAKIPGKPVLASWMGGPEVAEGESMLDAAGIPSFEYPDDAAKVFAAMWRYGDNLRLLYETPVPSPESDDEAVGRGRAEAMLAAITGQGRTLLDEFESKELLASYGLPVVDTRVAVSEAEAVKAAETIGYPVVAKLLSHTITHKTDVGGVKLDLADAKEVKEAFRAIETSVGRYVGPGHFLGVTIQPMIKREGYELIVGMSQDPRFGPVLLFGTGGRLVEVHKDYILGLPPLNMTLARRMIEGTRIHAALKGVRGRKPIDQAVLEQLLVRFARLVTEQPRIKEIEMNPLLAAPEGPLALDARIALHPAEISDAKLPRTAIRPYPTRLVSPWVTKDGMPVVIRPIRPEDEPLVARFHESLSERSVEFRYFHMIKLSRRVSHERLTRICFIDYDREIALVVDRKDPWTGGHEIFGIGRLTKTRRGDEAEFALLVNDKHQGQGIGTELLRRLLAIAKSNRVTRVSAVMLPENREMYRVCEKLGFTLTRSADENVVQASIDL